jgi:hypothetical protein
LEDHPEPTEREDELAAMERHEDEEAMRGPEHHDSPRPDDEDDEA